MRNSVIIYSASLILLLCFFLAITFKLYKNYWTVRYSPIGNYSTLIQPESNHIKYIVLGDSRSVSWDLSSDLMDSVQNLGLNGATSRQVVLIANGAKDLLKNKTILIQFGVNDLKLFHLKSISREILIRNFEESYKRVIDQCTQNASFVVCSAIFPVSHKQWYKHIFYGPEKSNALITEMNSIIEQLCKDHAELYYFDAFTPLLNNKGIGEKTYYKDFVHLNNVGYHLLNQSLIPILKSNGKRNN